MTTLTEIQDRVAALRDQAARAAGSEETALAAVQDAELKIREAGLDPDTLPDELQRLDQIIAERRQALQQEINRVYSQVGGSGS